MHDGRTYFSSRAEAEIVPAVAFTAPAWQAFGVWVGQVLREYCAGRAALQAANGDRGTPAPACAP